MRTRVNGVKNPKIVRTSSVGGPEGDDEIFGGEVSKQTRTAPGITRGIEGGARNRRTL